MGARIQYEIDAWLAGLVRSALSSVLDLLGRTIFSTPRVDGHPRVVELWRLSAAVADAALVLLVVAGSGLVVVGDGLHLQMTGKDLLARLVVAAASVNLSLAIAGQAISLSNALVAGLLQGGLDPGELSGAMAARILAGAIGNPFLALLGLVIVVLAILVVVSYLVRVTVLVVLLSGAPLFLVTHTLPQSESFARVWWRGLVAMLAVPIAQSLLLAAAVRVFLSGDGVLGLGGGLVDLLVIACLLYLLFRIPFWGIDLALAGTASRAWGSVKRRAVSAAKAAAAA